MVVGRCLAICSKALSVNTQTPQEPGPTHKVLSGPLSSFPIENIEESKSTIIDSGSQYMSNPVLFLSQAQVGGILLGLRRLSFSELHRTLWDNPMISILALRRRNLAPSHGCELRDE